MWKMAKKLINLNESVQIETIAHKGRFSIVIWNVIIVCSLGIFY